MDAEGPGKKMMTMMMMEVVAAEAEVSAVTREERIAFVAMAAAGSGRHVVLYNVGSLQEDFRSGG
jgi:hypothetical protein